MLVGIFYIFQIVPEFLDLVHKEYCESFSQFITGLGVREGIVNIWANQIWHNFI